MRVLIATPLYPPDTGGPATYTRILEEELPARDISVDVLSFSDVRHLPKGVSHVVYFWRLWKAAKHADIIFALDPVSVGLPACKVGWLRRKPLVVKVVGDYAWEQYQRRGARFVDPLAFQNAPAGPLTWLRKKVERIVARRAKRVITPSEYLKKLVMHWNVPEDRISVVHNAFEAPSIKESKEELRAMYGVEGAAVLSAGRLVPWKGFDALIEIMPDILKEFPSAKLYIAGDGPERENLELRATSYELREKVVFLGDLNPEALHRYMKVADVFALNTGYEGFSHTLLEAMSVGAPIVSTDAGGNPELIDGSTEGLLVSFNNHAELLSALLEVLRGHVDTEQMTENAQKKAGQFSRERMITETTRILKQI